MCLNQASPRPLHKVLVGKCSSSCVRVACAELLLTKAGQMAKPTSVLEEVNIEKQVFENHYWNSAPQENVPCTLHISFVKSWASNVVLQGVYFL